MDYHLLRFGTCEEHYFIRKFFPQRLILIIFKYKKEKKQIYILLNIYSKSIAKPKAKDVTRCLYLIHSFYLFSRVSQNDKIKKEIKRKGNESLQG